MTDAEKAKNQPARTGLVPVKLKQTDESQVKIGKTELVMERKWSVENHKGNKDIVLDVTPRQAIYIYKCDDCIIKVLASECSTDIGLMHLMSGFHVSYDLNPPNPPTRPWNDVRLFVQ